MKEYSPKRRTALVLTGTGTAGAYHAGVLKALDESGVKIDVVVGTGVGALGALFAAVAGGPRLYGPGGFWDGVRGRDLFRPRASARLGLVVLGMAVAVFLLPVLLAVLGGILVVPILVADLVAPGFASRVLATVDATPDVLRSLYLSALAVPSFVLALVVFLGTIWAWLRDRRRAVSRLEYLFDLGRARARAFTRLWEVAHGTALAKAPTSDAELGRRLTAVIADNLGQPGFRELILRVSDLETGRPTAFCVLGEAAREALWTARRPLEGETPRVVDLRTPGHEAFTTDALLVGLGAPLLAPIRRVAFPKGGPFSGETHRLAVPHLTGGCGLSDALASGAEQVIVVTATPDAPLRWTARRGPRAVLEAACSALERSRLETELGETERLNRIVETVGHPLDDGRRAWQDPVSGRIYRAVDVCLIRPESCLLGPLAFDGVRDPADVLESTADLMDRGYKDAHRVFLGPVVGGSAPSDA